MEVLKGSTVGRQLVREKQHQFLVDEMSCFLVSIVDVVVPIEFCYALSFHAAEHCLLCLLCHVKTYEQICFVVPFKILCALCHIPIEMPLVSETF